MWDEDTRTQPTGADDPLVQLSTAVRQWLEADDLDAALHDIVYTCCRIVPCHAAAIAVTSRVPSRRPVEVRAASNPDEFAVLLDIVARVPGSPGVTAAATLRTVRCPDLAAETRDTLVAFAAETVARTAVRSTVAFALHLRGQLVGVLNVYFTDPGDLTQAVEERAAAIADQAALVLGARQAEQRAEQLAAALEHSRVIGAAIGIIVERHRLSRDAAFELLRATSQNLNRKLHSVADELVTTGALPYGPAPG